MTLHIKLFGALELERDNEVLPRFASRKSGELFAYLALNRRVLHTREHLAGVFWGDSSEDRARHALNTSLWRINRVLEPSGAAEGGGRGYLRVTPQHIGFNTASSVWLDVAEFEGRCELAEQAHTPAQRSALYAQAVSFYRGDLLPDCYEDWCLVERERLQALYLRALARLLAYKSEQGESDDAIEYAKRILACDPLREEVHRDLMRLQLRAGQPGAALRQYRGCEELLRQELAVEPAPETRALLNEILGASSSPVRHLPRPVQPTIPDVVAMTRRVEELVAACDTARNQLVEAMAALRELTPDMQMETRPVPITSLGRVAGSKV